MRSPLPIRFFVALFAVALLTACARRAPELPPDYGSSPLTAEAFSEADKRRACADIDAELTRLAAEMETLDNSIHAERGRNQTAGIIAALFPLAILWTTNSDDAKQSLDEHQARRDNLIALKRYKDCGA